MMTLLLGWAVGTAHAQTGVVTKSVELCADYSVQYDDAVNTPAFATDGFGDFWRDNTDNNGKRAGIGLEYRIESSVDIASGNLGTNGCATRSIDVDTADPYVDITIFSATRRRGVDIEYRYSTDDAGHPGVYWWEDGAEISEVWTGMPIDLLSSQTNHDVLIPAVDGWQMLAVATWMIHRSKLGLDVGLERTCCLGGGADGTCTTSPTGYERDRDPYLSSDPKVWLLGTELVNDDLNNNGCCGSRIVADPMVESTGQYSGFSGAIYEQTRFTLAHELGHVMVGLRMGGYGVKRMSDLYINMCPRDWRANDGDCDDNDPLNIPKDLPFRRLHLSAEDPGVNMSTGLSNHIDGIEH